MIENLISIIVPVYNVEKYVSRCLDSILCQTYENIEIIVIDDGSTDRSGDICDEYAGQDIRLQVFHQPNRGLSVARNIGLSHAQGEYIGFVDSDDWISPDMYKSLYTEMIGQGADVVTCGTHIVINDLYVRPKRWTGKSEPLTTKEAIAQLLMGRITTSSCDKLYKREILSANSFPEEWFYEDIYATADIFLRCRRAVCMDSPYYYYTYGRKGSICSSFSPKHMKDMFEAHVFRNEKIKECYPDLKRFVYRAQITADIFVYRIFVHQTKADPTLKKLAQRIKEDMKQYPCSCLFSIPVTLQFSAILLRYFPVGFGPYVFFEKNIRMLAKSCINPLRYRKIR